MYLGWVGSWKIVLGLHVWLGLKFVEGDDDGNESSSLLWSGKGAGQQEKKARFVKAGFYAVQVFYSFFIM